MVVATILSLAVLGLALLVRGWVGCRTDDHPLCRRCGFDLTGRPATTTRCGECGADLDRRRAVRIGHRRRRPALLAGGFALVLVATLLAGGRWAAVSPRVDRLKPPWWLAHDVRAGNPARCAAAATELARRLSAGALAPAQQQSFADALLAVQSDPARPWQGAWGDLLEQRQLAGLLPPDRWRLYGNQAMTVQLHVPATVRQNDPIRVRLTLLGGRDGTRGRLAFYIPYGSVKIKSKLGPAAAVAGSVRFDNDYPPTLWSDSSPEQRTLTPELRLAPDRDGRVSLGPHTFVVHCRAFAGEFIGPDYKVVDQKPVDLPAAVMVVPDGELLPSAPK
jgi:hypothetical protein